MNAWRVLPFAVTLATIAHADTLRWYFPAPEDQGSAGFAMYIGPEQGNVITGARMHIVFVTDGSADMSEVGVGLSSQVDGTFKDWDVHGIDLGWGQDPGTYTADIESDLLNGVVWEFQGWPHSLLDFSWFVGAGYPLTYFDSESYFEVDYFPVPAPATGVSMAGCMLLTFRRRRRAC